MSRESIAIRAAVASKLKRSHRFAPVRYLVRFIFIVAILSVVIATGTILIMKL